MAKPSLFYAALISALAMSGCSKAPKDVSAYLARANQYIADGAKEKAIVELQTALRFQPSNPQANYALAQIEEDAGDLEGAIPHYARAAVPDAHLIPAQLRLVDVLLDAQRYQEASGRINMTLGASPDNAEALAIRADLEDRQDQTSQALNDTNLALAKDPKNARALAVQAALALRTNNTSRALAKIDQGLASHPKDIRLMQLKAAVLITTDQPEKAAAALKTIVQSSPSNLAAQFALADLDAKNGRLDDAISGLKSVLAANPSNQALQLGFVKFIVAHKDSNDVITYLRSMIGANKGESLYDLALAGYYRNKGLLSEAVPVLQAAEARLGAGSEGLLVKVALANVFYDEGRLDEADTQIESILASDANNGEALLFRGQMRLKGGRVEGAIDDLLAVVRLDPANARAFEFLANAYLMQGKDNRAVDAMRRVVALAPGELETQLKLAAFLQNAGNSAGAKELLARLKLEHPAVPLVWRTDAEVAIVQNDLTEASYAIGRLQDLPGQAAFAALLQGDILSSKGDKAGAISKFQSALAALPDPSATALQAYVNTARETRQTDAAATFLDQRASALKGNAQWLARMAVLDLDNRADRASEAASAYQKLITLNPRSPEPYLHYARNLAEQGKLDDARRTLADALKAGTPASQILLMQGWVENIAGNLPSAQSFFQQSMAADPASLEAANNYASILADAEPKNTKALTEVRQRLDGAEHSRNAGIVDTVAWLDYRLGRIDEAKALLESIKAGESSSPQLRFHMGAVLIAAGNRSAGSAILDTVKSMTFQGADEARALSAS